MERQATLVTTGGQRARAAMSVAEALTVPSTSSNEAVESSESIVLQNALGAEEIVQEDYIIDLSSVSLGSMWEEKREKIGVAFKCTMCGKRKELGWTTGSMVRMHFPTKEVHLCDRCCNILVDVLQYGPRVLAEAFSWELKSKFLRASVVHDELVCGQCLQRRPSHMFVKVRVQNKMRFGVTGLKDISIRRCSKCVYAFIDSMQATEAWREKFPYTW